MKNWYLENAYSMWSFIKRHSIYVLLFCVWYYTVRSATVTIELMRTTAAYIAVSLLAILMTLEVVTQRNFFEEGAYNVIGATIIAVFIGIAVLWGNLYFAKSDGASVTLQNPVQLYSLDSVATSAAKPSRNP